MAASSSDILDITCSKTKKIALKIEFPSEFTKDSDSYKFMSNLDFWHQNPKLNDLLSSVLKKYDKEFTVKFISRDEIGAVASLNSSKHQINIEISQLDDFSEVFSSIIFELCNADNDGLRGLEPSNFDDADDFALTVEKAEFETLKHVSDIFEQGIREAGWNPSIALSVDLEPDFDLDSLKKRNIFHKGSSHYTSYTNQFHQIKFTQILNSQKIDFSEESTNYLLQGTEPLLSEINALFQLKKKLNVCLQNHETINKDEDEVKFNISNKVIEKLQYEINELNEVLNNSCQKNVAQINKRYSSNLDAESFIKAAYHFRSYYKELNAAARWERENKARELAIRKEKLLRLRMMQRMAWSVDGEDRGSLHDTDHFMDKPKKDDTEKDKKLKL